jgi:hypothetical protein
MVKITILIVVCWSLTCVVNGQIGKKETKYFPATFMMSKTYGNACSMEAILSQSWTKMLSFRIPSIPQTTKMDYRKMVVMRDVPTKSTHPP